jgi:hypothetical protein
MWVFVIIALAMAAFHLRAAYRRPRVAIFVSAILWLIYAYYEYLVDTGVLCDAKCDIRADLVLFFPILYIATHYAYWSYVRPVEQRTIIGTVLGACGLIVFALLSAAGGYMAPAWVAGAGALALVAYAVKAKFSATRI